MSIHPETPAPTPTLSPDPKYRLGTVLRPFSYSVALAACGLGVLYALQQGAGSVTLGLLIVCAGVLLQAGVNLINNHADLPLLQGLPAPTDALEKQRRERNIAAIRWHFHLGIGCFMLAWLIAGFLIWREGWLLLLICVVGFLGGYFYTAEPIHYKRRGLGVLLSFVFMGVLMIGGSALAMGAPWTLTLLWLSLPFSLLTALLLLANELRDVEDDRQHQLRTLTVRIGETHAKRLYIAILVAVYLSTVGLWWAGLLVWPWLLALSLPLVTSPLVILRRDLQARQALPPATGQLFIVFAFLFLLSYSGGFFMSAA